MKEASLTWVFITGGTCHGKVDVVGVNGVDNDVWTRQGETLRRNTHDEMEVPWKSVRGLKDVTFLSF